MTEVELVNSFENRKCTLKQCEIAFFICELIDGLCPPGQTSQEIFSLVGKFLKDGKYDDEELLAFETKLLSYLGYWNVEKKFTNEKEARQFIESLMEKKIKSRIIGNFDSVVQ